MHNDEQQAMDQTIKAGDAAFIELLEAFPDLEDELIELYSAYVFKELSSKDFEQKVRKLCAEFVRHCVMTVKQGIKVDRDKRLVNAYFDVARYQTDRIDAAIEWNVDKDVLGFLLKKRPPPENPEERRRLPVPIEVTKKREF